MQFMLIPRVYILVIIFLETIDEIHLKCDVIDGSVVNGIREPITFSSISDKPNGFKVFFEPETIHKKTKSVLNTIIF